MNTAVSPAGQDPGPVPVTLILPCLNENAHIEDCLTSLLTGDYPADLIEVLVMEGLSTDGTRAQLAQMAERWSQIRVVDNPGASKPKGLNLGLEIARHDIVIRIDGHAVYPDNYIRDLVKSLHVFEADNVGGVRLNRTRGTTALAQALATVLTHPFGVGDAKHYTGSDTPIQSDIIFLFCAQKSLFKEVGGFDERLSRGQDREFNLRMTRLGKKMVLCPSVTCTYYAREAILPFTRWAYQSGKAPFDISRLIGENLLSWRNLVPPCFVFVLVLFAILGLWVPIFRIGFISVFGLYVLVAVWVSFMSKSIQSAFHIRILLPLSFFLWHFCYGIGALRGGKDLAIAQWFGNTSTDKAAQT